MEFEERIRSYIPDEYEEFEKCLDRPVTRSLRLNTRKMDRETFEQTFDMMPGKESPFTHDAWYVEDALGNHPWHQGGAFYLQEPSASAPVDILNVQPGDAVLDLCAAPGSKSTQIIRDLGDGFLVANEIDRKRASILLGNLERSGFSNFLCTNDDSKKVCDTFPEFFDRILVDAPCSGEGMIKKHEQALTEWSLDNIHLCATRQAEILDNAARALKPGGTMVYSTCTYAREENEDTVKAFLQRHPDFEQLAIDKTYGRPDLDHAGGLRIFPMDGGEGQFAALLRKRGSGEGIKRKVLKSTRLTPLENKFIDAQLDNSFKYYQRIGDDLYGMDAPFMATGRLHVLRQGVKIGTTLKNRFEPAQAFFLSEKMINSSSVELDDEQADAFLHGQQLTVASEPGWHSVSYKGIPFGFGKSSGTTLNNKFPKGLRYSPNSHIPEVKK